MDNNSLDLKKYTVRTDLAIEAREMVNEKKIDENAPMSGIEFKEEDIEGVKLTRMTIHESAAERLGKKSGRYLPHGKAARQKDVWLP